MPVKLNVNLMCELVLDYKFGGFQRKFKTNEGSIRVHNLDY